jgi:hypothetical protein
VAHLLVLVLEIQEYNFRHLYFLVVVLVVLLLIALRSRVFLVERVDLVLVEVEAVLVEPLVAAVLVVMVVQV